MRTKTSDDSLKKIDSCRWKEKILPLTITMIKSGSQPAAQICLNVADRLSPSSSTRRRRSSAAGAQLRARASASSGRASLIIGRLQRVEARERTSLVAPHCRDDKIRSDVSEITRRPSGGVDQVDARGDQPPPHHAPGPRRAAKRAEHAETWAQRVLMSGEL